MHETGLWHVLWLLGILEGLVPLLPQFPGLTCVRLEQHRALLLFVQVLGRL